MRLIAGSILSGFSLLAMVLDGLDGGTGGLDWSIHINVPVALQVLTWFLMALGIALIVWGLLDTLHSRDS